MLSDNEIKRIREAGYHIETTFKVAENTGFIPKEFHDWVNQTLLPLLKELGGLEGGENTELIARRKQVEDSLDIAKRMLNVLETCDSTTVQSGWAQTGIHEIVKVLTRNDE